jgi:hypothetical protein
VNTNEYSVIDRQYCGSEHVRCRSIGYVGGTLSPYLDYVINVEDGNYEEWKLEAQKNQVREVKGGSVAGTRVVVVNKEGYSDCLFTINESCNNATIIISEMTFLINTTLPLINMKSSLGVMNINSVIITLGDLKSRTSNIVRVCEGSLIQFEMVEFRNLSLLDASALRIEKIDVRILCSKFYNVTSNNSEGGVIYVTVSGMRRVEISNECVFENCSIRSNGRSDGGAIFVDLKEGFVNIGGNTTFTNCSAIPESTDSYEGKGFGCLCFFC